jgi:hypothetical protein
MKNSIKIYLICEAAIFVLSFIGNGMNLNDDTGFTIGLLNLLAGILMLLVSVILLIAGRKQAGLSLLAASGFVLLTGFITCSVFPFKLN